jgi:4-hydroxybenzoate polyprenyltransferase
MRRTSCHTRIALLALFVVAVMWICGFYVNSQLATIDDCREAGYQTGATYFSIEDWDVVTLCFNPVESDYE